MRNRGGSDWIGDTSDWWNGWQGDPLNRHISDLQDNAKDEERQRRALQQNEASRVVLDDDGFRVLANALLLAWWKPGYIDDDRARRAVNTELCRLRDFLRAEGVIAPEIDSIDGGNLTEFAARMDALGLSPAAFAQVEIKDLSPPNGEQFPLELMQCLANAHRSELRMNIARMGRCPLTLALRDLVIRYFEGANIWGGTAQRDNSGPRAGSEVAKAKKAQKVLEAIYSDNPDRRIAHDDAINCLKNHGFSGKESEAIWKLCHAPNWKKPGKIPERVERVPLDYLKRRLAEGT